MKIQTNKWCVYAHYVNEKCFYVGQGSMTRPFDFSNRNPTWNEIVKNNESSFDVKVLHVMFSPVEAIRKEQEEISRRSPECNMEPTGHHPRENGVKKFNCSLKLNNSRLFISQCLVKDKKSTMYKIHMYDTYSSWCCQRGMKPESMRRFSVSMRENASETQVGLSRRKSWEGVSFKK